MSDTKSERNERTVMLTFNISLLTNCYTFFVEEHIKYRDIVHYGHPARTVAVSRLSQTNREALDVIEKLDNIILSCFPDYIFVDHYLLFNTQVSGVPYSEDGCGPDTKFPLYRFLFDMNSYPAAQVFS
ncbi:hypothetical protein [Pedobacter faecalis]|uniref:hypothetical protein n=1 Tax=Pedobacter faecalis TaxID=3041495 RepID=UPI00254E2B92|nr:hypothetical protein [Pedobacter sp. ELA7]